jgi:hypothetical protein
MNKIKKNKRSKNGKRDSKPLKSRGGLTQMGTGERGGLVFGRKRKASNRIRGLLKMSNRAQYRSFINTVGPSC